MQNQLLPTCNKVAAKMTHYRKLPCNDHITVVYRKKLYSIRRKPSLATADGDNRSLCPFGSASFIACFGSLPCRLR